MEAKVPVPPAGARAGGSGARVLMRHCFSSDLLGIAMHSSALAQGIEETHSSEEPTFDIEHRSHVLSAVVSAAAFLEAAINELFQDACDGNTGAEDHYLVPLAEPAIQAMAATWRGTNDGSKLSALEKWQLLLIHAGHDPLDRGGQPYQDATLVSQLRNTILHFRPENVAADETHRLAERLQMKFPENRLMAGTGNPWWPDLCLGSGCAQWAVQASLNLTGNVCGLLGLSPNYQRIAGSGWHGKPPDARSSR